MEVTETKKVFKNNATNLFISGLGRRIHETSIGNIQFEAHKHNQTIAMGPIFFILYIHVQNNSPYIKKKK